MIRIEILLKGSNLISIGRAPYRSNRTAEFIFFHLGSQIDFTIESDTIVNYSPAIQPDLTANVNL